MDENFLYKYLGSSAVQVHVPGNDYLQKYIIFKGCYLQNG